MAGDYAAGLAAAVGAAVAEGDSLHVLAPDEMPADQIAESGKHRPERVGPFAPAGGEAGVDFVDRRGAYLCLGHFFSP